MSNPVFEESFVVYVDSEAGNNLVASVPGPAGSAFLRLPRGVTIEVDYAQPDQLVALHVAPGVTPAALATLIGAERAERVAQLVERDDGRPYRLSDRRVSDPFGDQLLDVDDDPVDDDPVDDDPLDDGDRSPGSFRSLSPSLRNSRNAYEIGMVGQLAVLQTTSMDPAMSELAQATASLEFAAAVAGGELLRIDGLAELLTPSLERAGELLAGVRTEMRSLATEQPRLADLLHKLCTRFANDNAGCASAARLLAEARRAKDNDSPSWHEAGRRYASAAPPEPMRAMQMRSRDDESAFAATLDIRASRAVPNALSAPEPRAPLRALPEYTASLAYGGRLTVRTIKPRVDEWLRVIHAPTLALVALAPMLEDDDGDWGAEALIPTDLALDDIALEITRTPLPNESSLVRTREAIRLGRDAVLASARGNSFRVRELWRLTAAAWEELGDLTRARLAHDYAMRAPKSGRNHSLAEQLR